MLPDFAVPDILVLAYHAVSSRWRSEFAVDPGTLERQLRELLGRGYRPARFTDAVTQPTARRTLAVTFDDAYRSVHALAFPVMRRLGVPGTVFVPTDFAGTDRPMAWPGIDHWLGTEHERELVPMDGDELRELDATGWEIGSHTRSHPQLMDLSDELLRAELVESRAWCEALLAKPCCSLAYPYGDTDSRVIAAARRAGYEAACTLHRRFRAPDGLAWPRIEPAGTGALLQLKLHPVTRRLRASQVAWAPVTAFRYLQAVSRR